MYFFLGHFYLKLKIYYINIYKEISDNFCKIFYLMKKASKVILYQDIDLGKVVSNAFKDRYLKNEGKIIFEESFRQEQVDPKSIVAKAISVNPDAIFVYANGIAYTEILNQLKQQSFSGEVLTCSTMTVVKDKLINGGENFIYADIDFGAGSSNAKSDEFSQKMIEKYSLPANSFAAFALVLATEILSPASSAIAVAPSCAALSIASPSFVLASSTPTL